MTMRRWLVVWAALLLAGLSPGPRTAVLAGGDPVRTFDLTRGVLAAGGALTRASPATYLDAAGTLQSVGNDVPRFGALGLLTESQATNGIRDNAMTGAVAADGVERAVNGTFATDPFAGGGGWTKTTAGTATAVWNGAGAGVTLRGDGTNSAIIDQQIATVAGLTYTISTTVNGATSTLSVGTSQGGTNLVNGATQAIGTTTLQVTASGATMWLRYLKTVAASSTISSVSVQSAGRLPDNWLASTGIGLLRTVLAVGTASGMPSMQLRLFGTATGAGTWTLAKESATQVAASTGQGWACSGYLREVAAVDKTKISSLALGIDENTGAGANVRTNATAAAVTTSLAQYKAVATLSGGGTVAAATPYFRANVSGAGAVDVTYEMAGDQFERDAVSSLILTSGAAATRAADKATLPISVVNQAQSAVILKAMVPQLQPAGGINWPLIQIDDGTANNRVVAYVSPGASGTIVLQVTTGGATTTTTVGTITAGTAFKVALAWDANGAYAALSGGAVVTAARAPAAAFSTFRLGASTTAFSNLWSSSVGIIRYRPADPVLQGMTR